MEATYSVVNTLRGLHLQVRRPQGKLIRVAAGEIRDVFLACRDALRRAPACAGVSLAVEP